MNKIGTKLEKERKIEHGKSRMIEKHENLQGKVKMVEKWKIVQKWPKIPE